MLLSQLESLAQVWILRHDDATYHASQTQYHDSIHGHGSILENCHQMKRVVSIAAVSKSHPLGKTCMASKVWIQ